MTRGRRVALAIGLPVCLVLVAGTAFSLAGDIGMGRYPVNYAVPAGTKALTLNVDGQLTIRPATAGQAATLTGTAKYSLVRSKLSESTTSSGTTIGYRCPIPTGDCELDATVTVPPTVTTLTANSGAGDATVTGTTGPVNLSTGDGNLSVSHASGPLTLNTASGSIDVKASTPATLSASSGDGNIQAEGVSAKAITANTNSGSIEVSDITSPALSASSGDGNIQAGGVSAKAITANTNSGSISWSGIAADKITASSGSGGIQITFTSVPANVRVNTNSGSITLVLPRGGTAYHIYANTLSGTVSDGTIPTVDSSGHVITATSGSGDISITEQ